MNRTNILQTIIAGLEQLDGNALRQLRQYARCEALAVDIAALTGQKPSDVLDDAAVIARATPSTIEEVLNAALRKARNDLIR